MLYAPRRGVGGGHLGDVAGQVLAGAEQQDGDLGVRVLRHGQADDPPAGVVYQVYPRSFLDSDGVEIDKAVKLAVTVTLKDGFATFDFSRSAPQAKGPINLRPSMIEACVFYCLIGCLDPSLQFNDGMSDAIGLILAPRTVTNAEPPAPVASAGLAS